MRRAGEIRDDRARTIKPRWSPSSISGKRSTIASIPKNPIGKAAFPRAVSIGRLFLLSAYRSLTLRALPPAQCGGYFFLWKVQAQKPDAAKPGFRRHFCSGWCAFASPASSVCTIALYARDMALPSSAFPVRHPHCRSSARKSTGMGTFVSTSLFASGIWCNAIGVVSHQPQFGGERPNDPLRPADPFCHFYQCSDGKWIGVFDNEYRRELPKFANLFGMPEIADDPRAASLEALHETDFVVEIVTRLNAIFKTKTVAEWEAFLSENNVSCERMRTIRDVSTDEQAIANGYIQKVTFKDDLEVMMPCPPMQFTEYAMRPYTSAGRLGADTDSIFHDLGYTDSEIAAMKDSGAIQ